MGGKFINKSYSGTINALTSGTIQKVKTANYVFNNKSPVLCNWYNIDKDATTIDEGSGLHYSDVGKTSPIRYKVIKDAVFYAQGIQIEINLEYDEEGLSTAPPSISGIILPNTWIPYQGDHFFLKQSGKEYLYRVNTVDYDTIENGNNLYKFDAAIDQTGETYIDKQVTDSYRMIINNVGTSFNSIVKESIYDCIDILDGILIQLKNNFISLFYNDAVQTFTYNGTYGKLYDPYMIEFISRNDILKGSDEYIFVHHEVPVPRTFSIDYNNTIYRALETKTLDHFSVNACIANPIDNQYSLFSTVIDQYFSIDYNSNNGIYRFNPISGELIGRTKMNNEFDAYSEDAYMNIIIKYMNDSNIDSNIIPLLEDMEFKPTVDMFYCIPMIIYVLEASVKKLMS
jgi:hypothetical protein